MVPQGATAQSLGTTILIILRQFVILGVEASVHALSSPAQNNKFNLIMMVTTNYTRYYCQQVRHELILSHVSWRKGKQNHSEKSRAAELKHVYCKLNTCEVRNMWQISTENTTKNVHLQGLPAHHDVTGIIALCTII